RTPVRCPCSSRAYAVFATAASAYSGGIRYSSATCRAASGSIPARASRALSTFDAAASPVGSAYGSGLCGSAHIDGRGDGAGFDSGNVTGDAVAVHCRVVESEDAAQLLGGLDAGGDTCLDLTLGHVRGIHGYLIFRVMYSAAAANAQ